MVIPSEDRVTCIPYPANSDSHHNITMSEAGKKKGKRLSSEMRQQFLAKGAHLIEFKQPTSAYDVFRRDDLPLGTKPALVSGKEHQSMVDKYRTMERKGLKVTKDIGCLIPDDQYSTYQQGATVKGHQRSFGFFARFVPKEESGERTRNEFGWPSSLQISHLCHRRQCCRIDHLIAEEQWRNQKRNYCGAGGACDCGNSIKCLRRYQTTDRTEVTEFCTTEEEVKAALVGAPEYILRPANYHTQRDKKAKQRKENRDKRLRKQEGHKHATTKKQQKLGSIPEEDDDLEDAAEKEVADQLETDSEDDD